MLFSFPLKFPKKFWNNVQPHKVNVYFPVSVYCRVNVVAAINFRVHVSIHHIQNITWSFFTNPIYEVSVIAADKKFAAVQVVHLKENLTVSFFFFLLRRNRT